MFNRKAGPTHSSLFSAVRRIGEPENFYVGIEAPSADTPTNILLFCKEEVDPQSVQACHHRYMLIFNLETAATMLVDNILLRLLPGQALLICPFQFHQYVSTDSRRRLWLFVTFELNDPGRLGELENTPLNVPPDIMEFVGRLVDEYRKAMEEPDRYATSLAYLCGFILAQLTVRQKDLLPQLATGAAYQHGHHLVQKACRYMSAHLDDDTHLADVARAISVSVGHLRNSFKNTVGMGAATYLRRMRIYHSCALLNSTEANITQISAQCGFQSLYAFSRAFRREVKMPPSEFRRRVRRKEVLYPP